MVLRGKLGFNRYESIPDYNPLTCMDQPCSYDALIKVTLYEGPKTAGRALKRALDEQEITKNQIFALVGNLSDQKKETILKYLKLQE